MKKYKNQFVSSYGFYFSLFGTNTLAVGAPNPPLPIADDSILSQHIKEADGTTGQDTNTGSGIKTGHIQDGAVTTGKIVDGSVTTPKITDNAVTTPKVADSSITTNKVVDGAITTPKIVDGAMSTSKIADGAVTDAKISGTISASKISSTGLNADTIDGHHASDFAPATHSHAQSQVTSLESALQNKADANHNHDTVYQKKHGKVAVVAQSGGDYTNPVTAMEDAATWCGAPSETNRCLLKIMPGVYSIGSTGISTGNILTLKPEKIRQLSEGILP